MIEGVRGREGDARGTRERDVGPHGAGVSVRGRGTSGLALFLYIYNIDYMIHIIFI